MKSVEVIVSAEGVVTVEAVGFSGQACEKATAAIEKALGMTKTKTKKKEWSQQNVQHVGGSK